jgi:UbiD family decarboxylase
MTWSGAQDLRVFLADYRETYADDVIVVDEDLAPNQDVTALVWQLAAHGHEEMLICPRVTGLGAELVTNLFASRERIARMLGTDTKGLYAAYQRGARSLCEPRLIPYGPVLDSVTEGDSVDLATVPMIQHFQSDRAPYITGGIIFARHPDTGVGNLSYHRAMVHSRYELATNLGSRGHLWQMLELARERGELLPVAMVIGSHPKFMLAAAASTGPNLDERAIAGGFFGEPLEVVGTPRYGLGVPATAELVLEGLLDPTASVDEGPFGEYTGHSSSRSTRTLFRVQAIMRRRDAILIDVNGGNSADHLNLGRVSREAQMAELLLERFPCVTGIHYPNSGTHFHCYVAVRPSKPGEARQVMLAILGLDPYLKLVIAVDQDVDIRDEGQIFWALATHFQAHRDLFSIGGLPGNRLDPSSESDGTTSRLALDATRQLGFEGDRIEIAAAALERAARRLDGLLSGGPTRGA